MLNSYFGLSENNYKFVTLMSFLEGKYYLQSCYRDLKLYLHKYSFLYQYISKFQLHLYPRVTHRHF